mmetsp:Transcript_46926/g.124151  ORF Transcript_46926/g.124151 Transcript_46926/m.124151 type:complete len:82 (+) Transcript_46926:679-924(+)
MEPTLIAGSKPVQLSGLPAIEERSASVDPPVLGTWRRAPVPTLGALPCGPAKLAYGAVEDVPSPPAMPLPVFPGGFLMSLD